MSIELNVKMDMNEKTIISISPILCSRFFQISVYDAISFKTKYAYLLILFQIQQ